MKPLFFFRLLGLSMSVLAGLPLAGHAGVPATVVLEKAVHFTSPEGDDVLVAAGAYEALPDEERLRLTPQRDGTVAVIQAEKGTHEQTIDLPVAVTMPGEGESSDLLFVGVLFPDGTSLQTTGSFSGVRGRGFRDHAQKFQQNARQAIRNAVQNVGARAPQVAQALCKAALRTRPAAVPVLSGARKQAAPILQDPAFNQLVHNAVQTIFRDKADLIRLLVDQARAFADPRVRERIKQLMGGERLCERPFEQTVAGVAQMFNGQPQPRSVSTQEMSWAVALNGEAEYFLGVQGAIGIVTGVLPVGVVPDPRQGRVFWSVGGTLVSDIGASGGVVVGVSFSPPPDGIENSFGLAVKGGADTGFGPGVGIQFNFAWDSIREEWRNKRLRSLVPYLEGIGVGISGSTSASPVNIGLDIGYTRVTRYAW